MLVKICKALASFFIGMMIAQNLFPSMGHRRWENEAFAVRRIANDLDVYSTFEANGRIRTDPKLIQQWLSDGLEPGDLFLPSHPGTDLWGNYYQFVPLLSDEEKNDHLRIGIYSLGENGSTQLAGNDSDDINSWSEAPTAFYRRRLTLRHLALCSALGLLFAPVVWVVLTHAPDWTIKIPKRWWPIRLDRPREITG